MVEYIPVVLKNHIRCQAASFTTLYSWCNLGTVSEEDRGGAKERGMKAIMTPKV